MKKFIVGCIHKEEREFEEKIQMNINKDRILIKIKKMNLNDEAIEQMKYEPIEIKVMGRNTIIFSVIRFGNLEWMKGAYHICQEIDLLNTYGDIVNNIEKLPVVIAVFDCITGKLGVLRTIKMQDEYNQAIKIGILIQEKNFISYETCLDEIEYVLTHFEAEEMATYSNKTYVIKKEYRKE